MTPLSHSAHPLIDTVARKMQTKKTDGGESLLIAHTSSVVLEPGINEIRFRFAPPIRRLTSSIQLSRQETLNSTRYPIAQCESGQHTRWTSSVSSTRPKRTHATPHQPSHPILISYLHLFSPASAPAHPSIYPYIPLPKQVPPTRTDEEPHLHSHVYPPPSHPTAPLNPPSPSHPYSSTQPPTPESWPPPSPPPPCPHPPPPSPPPHTPPSGPRRPGARPRGPPGRRCSSSPSPRRRFRTRLSRSRRGRSGAR